MAAEQIGSQELDTRHCLRIESAGECKRNSECENSNSISVPGHGSNGWSHRFLSGNRRRLRHRNILFRDATFGRYDNVRNRLKKRRARSTTANRDAITSHSQSFGNIENKSNVSCGNDCPRPPPTKGLRFSRQFTSVYRLRWTCELLDGRQSSFPLYTRSSSRLQHVIASNKERHTIRPWTGIQKNYSKKSLSTHYA